MDLAISCHEEGKYQESYHHLEKAAENKDPLAMYLLAVSLREGWVRTDPERSFLLLKESIVVLLSELNIDALSFQLVKRASKSQISWVNIHKKHETSPHETSPSSNKQSISGESSRSSLMMALSAARSEEDLKSHQIQQDGEKNKQLKECLCLPTLELGYSYLYGWGVKKDHSIAVYYLEIAAHLGDKDAQMHLGHMYENGFGVRRNKKTAAKYYRMVTAVLPDLSWVWKEKYACVFQSLPDELLFNKLGTEPVPKKMTLYFPCFGFLNKCLVGGNCSSRVFPPQLPR